MRGATKEARESVTYQSLRFHRRLFGGIGFMALLFVTQHVLHADLGEGDCWLKNSPFSPLLHPLTLYC